MNARRAIRFSIGHGTGVGTICVVDVVGQVVAGWGGAVKFVLVVVDVVERGS